MATRQLYDKFIQAGTIGTFSIVSARRSKEASMPRTTDSRIDNLERVALEFEGAQFATRHIVALILSRMKRHEAESCLQDLRSMGSQHKEELGSLA